jgi:hypothetical protein
LGKYLELRLAVLEFCQALGGVEHANLPLPASIWRWALGNAENGQFQ